MDSLYKLTFADKGFHRYTCGNGAVYGWKQPRSSGQQLDNRIPQKRFLIVQAEQDPLGLKNFQAPCEIGSNRDSHILSVLFAWRFFFYGQSRTKGQGQKRLNKASKIFCSISFCRTMHSSLLIHPAYPSRASYGERIIISRKNNYIGL